MSDFIPIQNLIGQPPTSFEPQTAHGEMGKNDFLQLMMAQLQNQDPTSPLDSSEYAAQLAQFTSVEQLANLSEATQQGIEANFLLAQSVNNTMAANLIGKDVKAYSNVVEMTDGKDRTIAFDIPYAAQDLKVTIYNSDGQVVRTLQQHNLDPGEGEVVWNGKDTQGRTVSDGSYSVEIEATDYSGQSFAPTPYVIGHVESVRFGQGGATLVVDGRTINFGDVIEIRNPADKSGGSGGDLGTNLMQALGLGGT
ncbi:hypothetical protein GF324_02485 [bacterium]|nr:hypothetical protein [bacterium]